METEHVSQPQSGSVENVREVTRRLSSRVEELSPDLFLSGAVASIALSFVLRVVGRQHDAQFVGQWAPTLLLIGLYTKEGRSFSGGSSRYQPGQDVSNPGMH